MTSDTVLPPIASGPEPAQPVIAGRVGSIPTSELTLQAMVEMKKRSLQTWSIIKRPYSSYNCVMTIELMTKSKEVDGNGQCTDRYVRAVKV